LEIFVLKNDVFFLKRYIVLKNKYKNSRLTKVKGCEIKEGKMILVIRSLAEALN
jgi:hypothetical protein